MAANCHRVAASLNDVVSPMRSPHKIRAFISYSHEDSEICETVRRTLIECGVDVRTDRDLRAGHRFDEQIQTEIRHAHVFLPILTTQSHGRGWVHQEIGFAIALDIPYLPVCVGNVPDGMLTMSQGIVLEPSLINLKEKLCAVNFTDLVKNRVLDTPHAEFAGEPEQRAALVRKHADEAYDLVGPCTVRVAGGLSTFSFPDRGPSDPVWRAVYSEKQRSHYFYELIRAERQALVKHATGAGLRMIVNAGLDLDVHRGRGVMRTRLGLLCDFLERTVFPDTVQVAVVREYEPTLKLAIGDWFYAESNSPLAGRGVLHTSLITHAPTVLQSIATFDDELLSILESQRIQPAESKERALGTLRQYIADLDS